MNRHAHTAPDTTDQHHHHQSKGNARLTLDGYSLFNQEDKALRHDENTGKKSMWKHDHTGHPTEMQHS